MARALERWVPWVCLAALAWRFYPSAFRFLDADEMLGFYVAAAVSRGEGLYADLRFHFPPALWYIGALFFALFDDPFRSLLAARLFIVTLGLVGCALLFDMYRRLRLVWFILPAAVFIASLAPFDQKLMEFRSDNLLGLVVVLQAYLLFLLVSGHRRRDGIMAAFFLLAVLSVHINQKAVFVDGALVLAMLLTQPAASVALLRKRAVVVACSALLVVGLLAFWPSYHRFLYYAYFETAQNILPLEIAGKLSFLRFWGLQNVGFWVLCLMAACFLVLSSWRRATLVVPPLLLLLGCSLLLYATFFPYLQYQLFLVWAGLLALPVATRMARDEAGLPMPLLWVISTVAALSCLATYRAPRFPYPPLQEYAATIRQTAGVVGAEPVASLGGTSITIKSALPVMWVPPTGPRDPSAVGRFYDEYTRGRQWSMRDILMARDVKFVFDPRDLIKHWATGADGEFIGLHYSECAELPLLLASQWSWVDPWGSELRVDIAGDYAVRTFGVPGTSVQLDGTVVASGQAVHLADGVHYARSPMPAVLFIELALPGFRSAAATDAVGARRWSFQAVNADFSGRFNLLGVLRFDEPDADVYRFFWQKTGDVERDLLAFHHFVDGDGITVRSENVDPGRGWFALRDLSTGEVFSYQFRAQKAWRTRWLRIGVYDSDQVGWRVPIGSGTYYAFELAQLP